MNTIFRKITLLKWIFIPVIIFARLIVSEISVIVLFISFNILYLCENYQKSEIKNTPINFKVRMNN